MRISEKIVLSKDLIKVLLFKKRMPLVVGWNITYRCNLKCTYCEYWNRDAEELSLERRFHLIEELASLGTKVIILSGGEPLLVKDLDLIIDLCKKKNMYVVISTNGTLIKTHFKIIENCDEVNLSLDGPRDINDLARGVGVYDKVIEAIEILNSKQKKIVLTTVISKYNVNHLSHMLKIASKYKIGVYFQPAGKRASGKKPNEFLDLYGPYQKQYMCAISYLINEKRRGNRFIKNSLQSLGRFYDRGNMRKIRCPVYLYSCIMEPGGKIFTCDMSPGYPKGLVSINKGFKEAFESLQPLKCDGKQCNAKMAELNLLSGFNLNMIKQIFKNRIW